MSEVNTCERGPGSCRRTWAQKGTCKAHDIQTLLAGGPGREAGALGLVQNDDAEGRVPQAQLAQPLAQHCGWAHDDGRRELAAVVQPRQEGRHLGGHISGMSFRVTPDSLTGLHGKRQWLATP